MYQIFKWIKNLFVKEEDLKYPLDYAIVDYSQSALQIGVRDNRNKIIYRYSVNEFGNWGLTKYRYSEERVKILKDEYNVPVYDKTLKNVIFPVFTRILPGEVRFTKE